MVALALAMTMAVAGKSIPTLIFSNCGQGPWQRVSANGQLLGTVAGTPLDRAHQGCYGFGHLIDGTVWTTSDAHFYILSNDLTRLISGGPNESGANVEQIVAAGSRHLYRIVRGDKVPTNPRRPTSIQYGVRLEEVNPRTWKVDRSWQLPGHYADYGLGHLAVDLSESVAYFATIFSPADPNVSQHLEQYGTIHRLDLKRGVLLPNLASRSCASGGILVHVDGSVIVAYTDHVRRFWPDGKELREYEVGSISGTQGMLSPGSTYKTFWVQGYDPESVGVAYSTMYEVDVESGLVRRQFDLPNGDVKWDGPFIDPPASPSCVPTGSLAFGFTGDFSFFSPELQPIVYMSADDGSLIGTSPPVVPGFDEVLDNGTMMNERVVTADWTPAPPPESYVYEPCTFDHRAVIGLDDVFFHSPRSNYTDRFYGNGRNQSIGGVPPPKDVIKAISGTDGSIIDTWDLQAIFDSKWTFLHASETMVVSAAGSANDVAYYTMSGIVGGGGFTIADVRTVFRYDLVGRADMTPLEIESARFPRSILVLRNGEILVAWSGASGVATSVVKHYAADGTILHTYPLSTSNSSDTPYLVAARDDLTFWVGYYDFDNPDPDIYSAAAQIRISDGVFLKHFTFTYTQKDAIDAAFGTDWQPDLGFFITRTGCGDCIPEGSILASADGSWKWTSPIGDPVTDPAGNPTDANQTNLVEGGIGTNSLGQWIVVGSDVTADHGLAYIYSRCFSKIGKIEASSNHFMHGGWATDAHFYVNIKDADPSKDGNLSWHDSLGTQIGTRSLNHLATNRKITSFAVADDDSQVFFVAAGSDQIGVAPLPSGSQSVLLTLPADHSVPFGGQQITVLPGTTEFIVGVDDASSALDAWEVRRYTSGGSLQATYPIVSGGTPSSGDFIVGIFPGVDGTTFWATLYEDSTGLVRFYHILVSDGSTIASWTQNPSGFGWDNAAYGVARVGCEVSVACPDPCEKAKIGEPYLAMIPPDGTAVLIYDRAFNDPPLTTIPIDGSVGVALVPSSEGLWVCADDGAGGSILNQYDASTNALTRGPITVVNEAGSPIVIAELGGARALFLISCDRMITVDRGTHDMVEICLPATDADDQIATVSRRFSLNVDPFDAQLINSGTDVLYVHNAAMAIWNLKSDSQLKVLAAAPGPVRWPTLLKDNTFLAYGGDFLGTAGNVYRFSRSGTLKMTIPSTAYISEVFSAGLFNLWADILTDVCDCGSKKDGTVWLPGQDDPAVIPVSLLDGSTSPDKVILLPAAPGGGGTASAISVLEPATGSGFTSTGSTGGTKPKKVGKCDTGQGLSTVTPNPGCNPGGQGWTPTYTGASGTVPTCADPTDGERLTGKRTVYMLVDLNHTVYPVGSSPTTEHIRIATIEINGSTHWKQGIRSIGTIQRAMSDTSGNMKASSTSIYITDTGRKTIGSRLSDGTKKFFARDDVTISMISDEGLRSGATARMISRGLCQGQSYGTSIEARFDTLDHLFSDGGAFGPDKKFPQWNYPLAHFTDAPTDMARMFLPVILGEVSDEGAKDKKTGLPSSRGKCPWRFTGMDGLGTAPGGEEWGGGLICLFASYQAIACYGSDLGAMNLYGRGATAAIVDAGDSGDDDTGGTSSNEQTIITLPDAGDLSAVPIDESANVHIFTATGKVTAAITGVNNATKEVTIGGSVDPTSTTGGVSWYIAMSDYVPKRVKIDLASRNGNDCMVFGWSGYVRPTPYEDFTSTDGDYRYTPAWFRGALLDAHLLGEVTIAFNMIGVESKGDGTGLPIIDYFTAYNWVWDNMFLRQLQAPLGGQWPQTNGDVPVWGDGFSITKQSTFAAMQALTASRLGGYGLRISAYFDAGIGIRDAIQLFNDNGNCRTWVDGYGRVNVWMLDEQVDTTSWPRIHHAPRVFGKVKQDREFTELTNYVKGGCDWDPEAGKFREDDMKAFDDAAITRNKTIKKYSKHFDLKLLAIKEQAQWILDRQLFMNKDGPVYVDIDAGDIGFLDYPIGSGIMFASDTLPSTDFRPMIILDNTFDVDRHTNHLVLLDLGVDGAPDQLIIPAAQRWIATDDTSIAPVASDNTTIAPRAAA